MPIDPEKIPIPEGQPEKSEITKEEVTTPEKKMESVDDANASGVPAPPLVQPKEIEEDVLPEKDQITMQVEGILEEDLGPIYAKLPDDAKPLFRKKGEDAAHEISTMLQTLKINTARILRVIRDWLLTIPKVNKFFLEQEAKIKTDRILELHEKNLNEPPTP